MRGTEASSADLCALATAASGAVWAHAGAQLNATLLSWPAGHTVASHVNEEREVLLIGVGGEGVVVIDGIERSLCAGVAIIVPQGSQRTIVAGSGGFSYVSIHGAREPLALRPHFAHPRR